MTDEMPDSGVKPVAAQPGPDGRSRTNASPKGRANRGPDRAEEEFAADQAEHQDRGQTIADAEADWPERLA